MRIERIYYIPFDEGVSLPPTSETIRNPRRALPVSSVTQTEDAYLTVYLTGKKNRLCAGRFSGYDVRLLLVFDNGSELLMDSNGCVKYRGESYYVLPGSFLRAYKLFEEIRQKHGRR